MIISLLGCDTAGRRRQLTIEEIKDLAPAVDRLLGPIGVAQRVEEGVSGAVVAVELVGLAEFLQHRLGAVDLVGGRIGVVVAENAEQRTGHLLGGSGMSKQKLGVEQF